MKNSVVKKASEKFDEALDIARHNNLTNKQISFLLLLSKEYPNDPKAKTRLLELANIMYKINKKQAANVLYSGVLDRFADTDAAEEAKSKRAPEVSNVKQYLTKVGEDVFVVGAATRDAVPSEGHEVALFKARHAGLGSRRDIPRPFSKSRGGECR